MKTSLQRQDNYWIGTFEAMASPCEVLMDLDDTLLANKLLTMAYKEAKRIEQKFSRYRDDNIIYKINNSCGEIIEVDEETAKLLDYANQCYQLSDGKFDITSGVLRKIWKFDSSNKIPSREDVNKIVTNVGWEKVNWQSPFLTLPENMEIDLGGVGKEYAVDRTAILLMQQTPASLLINFGGDLYITGRRSNGQCWNVAVDDPGHTGEKNVGSIELVKGAITTSGDARRFLINEGIRYSHILDPKTGWPVPDAPRSVTVVGNTCLEAGMLATFAMLQGKNANAFLKEQGVNYRCII